MHVTHLPAWAIARGEALNSFPALTPARTALVNIDMQSVFLAEDQIYGNANARDIVGAVNALSAAMRGAGGSVIWTRQTHTHHGPGAPPAWQYDETKPGVAAGVAALQAGQIGQIGHGLYPAMQTAPDDVVLDKYRYGALSCPAGNLRRALDAAGAEMVVITGTLTNCCCDSTAREANLAGFKVIIVSDATATLTDEEHNAALLNLRLNFADVRTTAEVLAMITDTGA
jgi:ureidoacrylate peracid hydrolase